jgi:signal transduction histidine kinase
MRIARALRFVGYGLVLVAGESLWIQPLCFDRETVTSLRYWIWLLAYGTFAISFHVSASSPEGARSRRLGALAVMAPAVLLMEALLPCEFGALSLIVVASQAALVLSRRQTAAFILAETLALTCLLVLQISWYHAVSHVLGILAAESFAAVAVHLAIVAGEVARRETETAGELADANAELRATRALLEETSRARERTRISRELHDVLGHDLTALGLQLEVATHVPADQMRVHLTKAKVVSARLLQDVRQVVGALRETPGADLATSLRTLVEAAVGVSVHLEMPAVLRLDDAARAQCVLRCVQEIVTNALRHSSAKNLWIAITEEKGMITIDAHDDGRGAALVQAGHGLSGMRARLEEMGGWLSVAAGPSRAFRVSARLPADFPGRA